MGATTFIQSGKGKSVKEAFEILVDWALLNEGHDPYNGTISTTNLHRDMTHYIPANLLKSKTKKNREKIENFLMDEKNDEKFFPEKWATVYIDLGISHYEAFTNAWVDDKETPKRKNGVTTLQVFIVEVAGRQMKYNSLSEAKRVAKELTFSFKEDVTIYKLRSDGSKFQLGHMNLVSDGKEYKSARQSKSKLYLPISEFIFCVYAAC